MSESPTTPNWDELDIPVDDDAEPDDAEVEHQVPPEDLED